MSDRDLYCRLDVTPCFAKGNVSMEDHEYFANRPFTDEVSLCQKIAFEAVFNRSLDNFKAIASETTRYRTMLDNDTIDDIQFERLRVLEKTIEELGFTSVEEILNLTRLSRDEYTSKYVFACTLWARDTAVRATPDITTLYRRSLVLDMQRLLCTDAVDRVDYRYRLLATRQCAIILVQYASHLVQTVMMDPENDLDGNNVRSDCIIWGRHILQFGLLRFDDIVKIGYNEWKSIFLNIFGRFGYTFVARTIFGFPPPDRNVMRRIETGTDWRPDADDLLESDEYYLFYVAIFNAYGCYVKTKSSWSMLEVDTNITGVVTHALTAIKVLQKQPRLINWKSPFNRMTRENLDRLAAVDVLSVRQNNELLDIIHQAVSSFFEKNVPLFETSCRRIKYYVFPDDDNRRSTEMDTRVDGTHSSQDVDDDTNGTHSSQDVNDDTLSEDAVSLPRLQVGRNIVSSPDEVTVEANRLNADVNIASEGPVLNSHTNTLRVARAVSRVARHISSPSANRVNTDVNIASEGPVSSRVSQVASVSQVARDRSSPNRGISDTLQM